MTVGCKTVTGTVPVPQTCVQRYAGTDGMVQKAEAVQAVLDYFDGLINKQCAVDVVLAYFEGGGTDTGQVTTPVDINGTTPAGTTVIYIPDRLTGTIDHSLGYHWTGVRYIVRFSFGLSEVLPSDLRIIG